MISGRRERESSRDSMCVCVHVSLCAWGCVVSITVNQWPCLVLQRSAARQALMHGASSRNHLIIYCTDRQRAGHQKEDTKRDRGKEHRQGKKAKKKRMTMTQKIESEINRLKATELEIERETARKRSKQTEESAGVM